MEHDESTELLLVQLMELEFSESEEMEMVLEGRGVLNGLLEDQCTECSILNILLIEFVLSEFERFDFDLIPMTCRRTKRFLVFLLQIL